MARLPRYFVKGVPLHIILRGNNRQVIFASDGDYRFFSEALKDAAKRNGLAIHAYVLMSNHVHLLATPDSEESVPKTMQSLGRRYVQYFNYHNQRTGTLWEGRYRATVVETENYLFECMRYIELNPVRAGMVKRIGDYPWSSYRCNGGGQADSIVTPHKLYRRLGLQETERVAAYRELAQAPLDGAMLDEIRTCTNKGWALGGSKFKNKVEALTERRTAPLPKGRPRRRDGA